MVKSEKQKLHLNRLHQLLQEKKWWKDTQFRKGHIPYNKGKKIKIIKKQCLVCGIEFETYYSKVKCCSRKCALKIIGKAISKGKRGKTSWRKGKTKFKSIKESKETQLRQGRECYQRHIEQRRFYYRQLNCKRRSIKGKHSFQDWLNLKKKYNNTCLICGKKEPEIILTEDHIIPISKWEEWIKKYSEIKYQCNDIENIQPLCKSCNIKKFNHIPYYE